MTRRGLVSGVLAGCSLACGGVRARPMSAAEFWNVYYRNGFLRLKRENGRWTGEFRTDANSEASPAQMLRPVPSEPFEIPFQRLSAYDYNSDPRFGIPESLAMNVGAAFRSVVEGRYPYRDAPFGRKRMGELFADLSGRLSAATELRLDQVEDALRTLLAEPAGTSIQPIAAVIWFIGERRERGSSGVLLEVLRRPRKHFTAEEAAFHALEKVNDKRRLSEFIQLMTGSDTTGRWKYARLLERLLSRDELLSAWREGDRYADPEHWRSMLGSMRSLSEQDWDRYDEHALRWELRYLSHIRQMRRRSGDSTAILRRSDPQFAALCAR